MNRLIQILNFLGVCVLAALLVFQWRTDSRLNLQINALTQKNIEQAAKIDQQTTLLKEDAADLEDFRQRLSLAEQEQKETQTKLTIATTTLQTVTVQRDQLATDLQTWKAALAARDAVIKDANQRLQKQAAQYSDLVDKYNALVKRITDQSH